MSSSPAPAQNTQKIIGFAFHFLNNSTFKSDSENTGLRWAVVYNCIWSEKLRQELWREFCGNFAGIRNRKYSCLWVKDCWGLCVSIILCSCSASSSLKFQLKRQAVCLPPGQALSTREMGQQLCKALGTLSVHWQRSLLGAGPGCRPCQGWDKVLGWARLHLKVGYWGAFFFADTGNQFWESFISNHGVF